MRKNIQYTAILLALAVTASCNKIVDTPDGDDMIRFAPQAVGTKAMINDEDGLKSQTFDVVDLLDGETYIENTVVYNNGWAYTSPADAAYMWKAGSHKLFGYTAGLGTFAGTTLTLPATTLTTAYDQTDLLYSDIVSTTADAWKAAHVKGDPVQLHFHHLLSAISITVENQTPEAVTINSVAVSLPNAAPAPTISFAGTAPAVNIGTLTKGNFIGTAMSAPVVLASKDSLDALAQAKLASKAKPAQYMVWPQTLAAGDAQITLSYIQDGATKSATVNIPASTVWNAGEVNSYNLLIRPTSVELVFEVQPWEKVEGIGNINTATGSINMSNVTWVQQIVNGKNTVDNNGYGTVYLIKNGDTYTPARGYFTVNYPTEGTYEISLIPAYGGTEADLQYFSVSPSGGTLPVVNGIPQTIYFTISAVDPGTAKHVAAINITITPKDGEPVSAYSEIRANYTLTINDDPAE